MKKFLDRITQISDYKDIKISALEQKIGASKGVLSRAIKNGTDIQSKWIRCIVENYPDINSEWLLTGNGSMIKTDQPQGIDVTIDTNSGNEDVIDILKYTISLQKEKIERLERQLQKAKSRKVIENEHIA